MNVIHVSQRPVASRRLLSRRERDFLLLNIFVLFRHGHVARALVLADALNAAGDESPSLHLARAVLRFARGEWRGARDVLDLLDRINPIERFGTYRLDHAQRMRRYLKTRCLFELGDTAGLRDALESYLRHGSEGGDEGE